MSTVITRSLFDEVMVPNYSPASLIPVRGQGAKVWDQENNEYIDFGAGIAVNALGHAHPELIQTLTEQSHKLWHVSNLFTNEPALHLASRLCSATFADKVFFCNSGAEANEAALKLARKYASDHFDHEKHEIISFYNSFHGRTLFTVSVGGQEKYTQGFEPLPAGITHLPFNDIEAFKNAISDKTCAVIVELIQGEGGVRTAHEDFVVQLRELCDKHKALLIFDEVQTGVGRTGHMYAYMHYTGILPDILTTAKALGGGFPIGAMLTTTDIAQSFQMGTHGTTYGGNPLACAVADKAFEIIQREDVLHGINERHELFVEYLTALNQKFDVFEDIRGRGLLLGCELKKKDSSRSLLKIAQSHGLLLLVAGPDIIRLAPPLNIDVEDIKTGFARFAVAIEEWLGS